MKIKAVRRILIFWELFIGIGAVFGALMMFVDPSGRMFGMELMLPLFQVLPLSNLLFHNFIFPGIALLVVNGLTNIVAFWLLKRRSLYASRAGIVCGVILMLWISLQFYLFPLNFVSTFYFLFGALEALAGYCLYRKEHATVRS